MKIASATDEILEWNWVAMALTQKVRMKKSNASSDQPRKQAVNVFRCKGVSRRKWPRNSIEISQVYWYATKSPANASILSLASNPEIKHQPFLHARPRLSEA